MTISYWAMRKQMDERYRAYRVQTEPPPVRLGEVYTENISEYLQTLAGVANLINNMELCDDYRHNLEQALRTVKMAQGDLKQVVAQIQIMLED